MAVLAGEKMKELTVMDIEQISCRLYQEFYAKHQDLYKSNPQQYWHEMHEFKEEQMIKFKYNGVN